jgi:hypothetical protein
MPKTASRRRSGVGVRSGRPVVVHFGCGRLGTGAVLPFLIQQYGTDHTIIAVQRLSSNWERVPTGMLSIDTKVGDKMPFGDKKPFGDKMPFQARIIKRDELTAAPISELLESLTNEHRILLLVPGIALCHELLRCIRQNASDLIVSCSLGEGQNELIRMLRLSNSWSKTLIFENTAHKNWKGLKRCYQVIVDRICWHVEPYSPNIGIVSHCEKSEYVRFCWPKSAGVPEKARPGHRPEGEQIDLPPESLKAVADGDFKREYSRKRALINAPHAIAAVLSHRVLADRGMAPGNQYLAPLQGLLEKEYPHWYQAMDHYLRLRAIEVAWSRYRENTEQEQLHKEYLDAYGTAKKAETRFFETNDRLDRLMNAGNFSKELSKLDEHILKPLQFYENNRDLIRSRWVYGRPTDVDFQFLRGFLYESFISAGQWLISNK